MDKRTKIIVAIGSLLWLTYIAILSQQTRRQTANPAFGTAQTPPLVMADGDPHIRALMRMISASESNDRRPYSILYGGSHITDLSRHPSKCIRIVNGPNMNNCSTAAGRYQMINTTWARMANKYHPRPECILFVFECKYSFEAEYQDAVVHAWLIDRKAWNMDIPQLLKEGHLEIVRKRLSSTWTSLGYGIETNSMTSKLSGVYQKLLQEELARKGQNL
jgi:muramidase (phage lysozyme)